MLLIEHPVGRRRGGATGEGDMGTITLIERQIDQGGDALSAVLGQLGGVAHHLQLVGGAHRRGPAHIHSVWNVPG